MKVFLGGSIKLSTLPSPVVQLLAKEIANGASFAVGDAMGIDLAFQRFLKANFVKTLTVFHSDILRNNIGDWPTEFVESDLKSSGKDKFTIKDRRMTELANCGIMVWDGRSAGTLANVIDLLQHEKPCQVFLSPRDQMFLVSTMHDLDELLLGDEYKLVLDEANKRLARFRRRTSSPTEQTLKQPTLPGFD